MSFNSVYKLILCFSLFVLTACSDPENETDLVNLFTSASLDIIAINFPVDTTEKIIATNTFVDYTIEGLKSNGVDSVAVNESIIWSLSAGAVSTVDQNGRLSSGSGAEVITLTAQVGNLTQTQDITVSAAKFDQVVQLNSTTVQVNLCQAVQINPIARYVNDDGSEEIRPVDNSVINDITWLIRDQEDDVSSQRAFIKTENNIVELQALAVGNVFIQAQALSLSSGSIVTSVDFSQTIDHNINSLKLCLSSNTDLAACLLNDTEIEKDSVVSLVSIANYQATDGTNYNQNVTAFSKWGVDNSNNATLLLSADRQQLNITGNITNTTANISAACGDIEESILDSDIKEGVVLTVPVTCDNANINCLPVTAAVVISDKVVDSLSVTVNNLDLIDNEALALSALPVNITLKVTANYSDNSSQDVTTDIGVIYNNQNLLVLSEIADSPGEYTVVSSGNARVQITFQSRVFVAKITIPN